MKSIKHYALMALILAAGMVGAQQSDEIVEYKIPAGNNKAAAWQYGAGKAALAKITPKSLEAILKDADKKLTPLFNGVKADRTTSPLIATQVASLTEFVMTPAGAKYRKAFAKALFEKAKSSTDDYLTCFFLNQLRWCGLADQSKCILEFAKSRSKNVKDLAKITSSAVRDDRTSKYKKGAAMKAKLGKKKAA